MTTITTMPVSEYLKHIPRPDCEYIDGVLLERNVGTRDHSNLQTALAAYLHNRRKQLGITVLVEQRVQVTATRFRIPDVLVAVGPLDEPILMSPPFLCIEILSPDDRFLEMRERVQDYLTFGVSSVWVIDPKTLFTNVFTSTSTTQIEDGPLVTASPDIFLWLSEVLNS